MTNKDGANMRGSINNDKIGALTAEEAIEALILKKKMASNCSQMKRANVFKMEIIAIEKQIMLAKWIEQINGLDFKYNTAELASVLRDFLVIQTDICSYRSGADHAGVLAVWGCGVNIRKGRGWLGQKRNKGSSSKRGK